MRKFLSILLSVTLLASSAQALRARANHPLHHPHHCRRIGLQRSSHFGIASWYGQEMRIKGASYGKRAVYHKMADGVRFDPNRLTAASRTLPLGTVVRVTDLKTRLSVNLVITDRGPFTPNRILDLAEAAANKIQCRGLCWVYLDWYDIEPPIIKTEPNPLLRVGSGD